MFKGYVQQHDWNSFHTTQLFVDKFRQIWVQRTLDEISCLQNMSNLTSLRI